MQNALTLQGHAPAVRASRALRPVSVRKMCARAISLARRKSVTLAVISATLSVAGIALGSDPLTYVAGFVALGFVWLANKEGGDK